MKVKQLTRGMYEAKVHNPEAGQEQTVRFSMTGKVTVYDGCSWQPVDPIAGKAIHEMVEQFKKSHGF